MEMEMSDLSFFRLKVTLAHDDSEVNLQMYRDTMDRIITTHRNYKKFRHTITYGISHLFCISFHCLVISYVQKPYFHTNIT